MRSFTFLASTASIAVLMCGVASAAPTASPAPSAATAATAKIVTSGRAETTMTCMVGAGQTWKLGSVNHQYNVQLPFTKSSGGASTLQAGQCAFADRAVAASEPSQVCFSIDMDSNQVSLHGTGSTLDSTSTFNDGSKRGAFLQDVISGTAATLTFNVEPPGPNCFRIIQMT